jgi:hypothetical protein
VSGSGTLPRWRMGDVFPTDIVGDVVSTFQCPFREPQVLSASEDAASAPEPLIAGNPLSSRTTILSICVLRLLPCVGSPREREVSLLPLLKPLPMVLLAQMLPEACQVLLPRPWPRDEACEILSSPFGRPAVDVRSAKRVGRAYAEDLACATMDLELQKGWTYSSRPVTRRSV